MSRYRSHWVADLKTTRLKHSFLPPLSVSKPPPPEQESKRERSSKQPSLAVVSTKASAPPEAGRNASRNQQQQDSSAAKAAPASYASRNGSFSPLQLSPSAPLPVLEYRPATESVVPRRPRRTYQPRTPTPLRNEIFPEEEKRGSKRSLMNKFRTTESVDDDTSSTGSAPRSPRSIGSTGLGSTELARSKRKPNMTLLQLALMTSRKMTMGSPFGIRRLVHMQNLLIAIHNGYSKLLPNARQAPSNPEQQVVPEIPVPPLRIDSLTAGDTDDAMAAKPLPPIVDDGTTRQWSPERKFFKETPRLAMDFFTKDEVPLESMFEDAMASTRFAVHYNQTIATSRDNILPDPSTTADQQDTRSESETSLSMPSKSSSEDVVVNAGRSTLSPIEESATFEVLGDLREQETTISDTQTSSEGPSDVATVETTPPLPPPRSVFHVPPPPRKAPPRTLSRDLHPPAITTTRSHTSPSYKSPSSSKSPPLSACKALPAVPPSPLSPERGGASTGARETGGRDSRSLRRSMSDPTIHVTYASQAPPMPGFAVGESAATYAARGPAVRRPMAFFGNAVRRARTSWTPLPSGSPLPASRGGSSDEDGTARTGNAGVGVTPSLRWKRSKVNIMAVAVLGSIFNKAGGRREDREEEEMPVAVATSKGEMQVRRSASFENGGADGRASWRLMSSNSSVGGDGGRRRRASLDAAVGSWLNGVLGPVDGQSEREEEKVYEAPVVRKPMRLDGPFEWETKGFMGLESDLVVGESSYDAIVSPKSVPEPAKPNPVAKVAPDSPPAVPPKSHKPAKSPMPFPPPSPPKSTSERPLSPTRIPRAPESVAAAAAEPAAPARPIAPTSPTRRGRKNQTETVFQGAELEEMRGLMKGLSKLEGPVVKQQQQQQPQQQRQANGRRSQRSGTGQQAPSGVRDKPAAGSLFTPFSLATREELVTGRTLMEEIFEQEFGGAAAVVGGRASVKGKEESLGAFAAVRECDAEVGSSLRTPRGGALEVGVELEHERMKSGMLDSVFRLDWSLPM